MGDKKLKTFKEHNDKRQAAYAKMDEPQPTGVACPECDEELMTVDHTLLASWPPQRSVRCKNGHQTSIVL